MSGLHRLKKKDVLPAVGRDIDAWCTKCKLDLGHTITAMVDDAVAQVRCNTCNSVHRFKAAAAGKKAAKAKAKAKAKPKTTAAERAAARAKAAELHAQVVQYQRLIADRDLAKAEKYSPRMDPSKGTLIEHSKFGTGVIVSVAGGKAAVLFPDGRRLLVVQR